MKLYKVNGKWLNLGQIADMVGVSRPTIYNRINKGFTLQETLDYFTDGYKVEEKKEIKLSGNNKAKIKNALNLIDNYIDNWKDGFELTDLIEIRKVLKKDER